MEMAMVGQISASTQLKSNLDVTTKMNVFSTVKVSGLIDLAVAQNFRFEQTSAWSVLRSVQETQSFKWRLETAAKNNANGLL